MLVYLLAGTSIIIAIGLMLYLAKNIKNSKNFTIISLLAVIFIMVGLTIGLSVFEDDVENSTIIIADSIIFLLYLLGILFYRYKQKQGTKILKSKSTREIAVLSIVVGLASVLMLIGFPVIPVAPYLKVELSALIIFMTFLWFDFKTAVIVSLITNIAHFLILPGNLIPFLDEMINFLATMLFILPTALFLNKKNLNEEKKTYQILILTAIGFVSVVVLMVLFNQYINLPLIYNIDMSFTEVIAIFGLFNIIKWGANSIVINLTWKRFYVLRKQ